MAALIASLILPVSVFAQEQQNQNQQGEQRQRPSPAQMTEHLMNKFDANKDGELTQDELTQMLETLRKNRPQRAGGEGKNGDSSGSPKNIQGGHPGGFAGGAGQQGAGQNRRQGLAQGDQPGQNNKEGMGQGGLGQRQGPPPADKVAAKMIEKFSSDKKGLTQSELTKALEELRARRSQLQGGQEQGGRGQGQGGQGQQNRGNRRSPSALGDSDSKL
jgi:hypothetical protein